MRSPSATSLRASMVNPMPSSGSRGQGDSSSGDLASILIHIYISVRSSSTRPYAIGNTGDRLAAGAPEENRKVSALQLSQFQAAAMPSDGAATSAPPVERDLLETNNSPGRTAGPGTQTGGRERPPLGTPSAWKNETNSMGWI